MALIGVTGDQTWPPVTPSSTGGTLHRYDVVINGNKTTLLLSDADAEAAGLTPVTEPVVTTKAKTPANKSRKPANKSAESVELASPAKRDGDE